MPRFLCADAAEWPPGPGIVRQVAALSIEPPRGTGARSHCGLPELQWHPKQMRRSTGGAAAPLPCQGATRVSSACRDSSSIGQGIPSRSRASTSSEVRMPFASDGTGARPIKSS